MPRRSFLRRGLTGASAVLLAWAVPAQVFAADAPPKTVCTVTINSSDEKEAFMRHLPRERYRFVELIERGNPGWLDAARRRGVTCDVLVISGHFDDGSEFYSDRFDEREFLTVHALQQASCSASASGGPFDAASGKPTGAGLFAQLKEVYLFGCNTLKSTPRYTASGEIGRSLVNSGRSPAEAARSAELLSERYGQSNRDRLRHIFKDVPVLYGFSSKAPLGRFAGPLLERYFRTAPAGEVGSGQVSATLLKLFGPSSMIAVAGLTDADPHAGFRGEMCGFADDRPSHAHKLAFMHRVLQRDATEVRALLDHIERYAASLGATERRLPEVAAGLTAIEHDHRARDRFLAFAHDADEAPVQARMIALAGTLHWLSPAEERSAFLRVISERMARGTLGPHEVDLVCESARERDRLRADADGGLARRLLDSGAVRPDNIVHSAVLACLGSAEAHRHTVRALTGPRDEDVTVAQTYLRHRPLAGADEVRAVTSGIARMSAGDAQVRALQTLARQQLSDAQSLREIAQMFPLMRSLEAQRAIAGILIRADTRALVRADLARSLRQHRMKSPDGADVIDMLIRVLQSG